MLALIFNDETTTGYAAFQLALWFWSFASTLIGLFCSLFMLITHDDLSNKAVEPGELAHNINQVRQTLSNR